MRDYGKVAPTFWTGETGRILRGFGRDTQLVALYLMTGPSANMIGLYHLPMPLLCHHTGLSEQGACKALQRAIEGEFARWDAASEVVFVPMMALHQIGERLSPKDNRHKWIVKELQQWRKSLFAQEFHTLYATRYNLPPLSPLQAPCKPLRSQELEKEQEQEQEQEKKGARILVTADAVSVPAALDTIDARAALAEWLTYKAKRGESYRDPAYVGRKLAEFAPFGPLAFIQAVNSSIGNNYSGLFPPKGNSNGSNSSPRVGPGQRYSGPAT